LDLELKNIKDMGAKPFLSVSYMPPAISKGDNLSLPKNWSDWSFCVLKLIEHVSGNNNLAIADVYYEIWNEPDLFGSFKTEGEKNYLTLYQYAAEGAARSVNVLPYKIGGPATTALYKNWFDRFFEFATARELRVDFYSWHRYTDDLSVYSKDISNVRTWIESYPGYANSLFIISEFGPTSEVDPVYDAKTSGIHTLAFFANDKIPDLAFLFEIKDGKGNTKYWGRWGILTNEAFGEPEAKPRYEAVKFLQNLKGVKLNVSGQGSWVKAFASWQPTDKKMQVLLVNYDKYGLHEESVPLQVINIPFSKANIQKTVFSGDQTSSTVMLNSNIWNHTENLAPNSAVLYELTSAK
jgi:hypothetical protein